MITTLLMTATLSIAAAQDTQRRADLTVPQALWNTIDHQLGLEGRPLGYTQEQMSNYGRDLHVLRPVLRQFEDVRSTLRFSGRSTDLLLDNAMHEDEFIRHAFAQFLDEGVGRRIRLPGLDANGTSGELPDSFDPVQESGGWSVDWLGKLEPADALRTVLERLGADAIPPALDSLPTRTHRLLVRLLVTAIEVEPWLANAFDHTALESARDISQRAFGTSAGYPIAIAPRLDMPEDPVPRGLLDLVATTDLGYLGHAGVLASKRVRLALAEHARGEAEPADVPLDEAIRIRTASGEIIILGTGNDTLEWLDPLSPLLVLDLGGDDSYIGTFAVSDGVRGRHLAMLIDLGGNDTYRPAPSDAWLPAKANDAESEERHAPTLSAGVFGIGMLWDLGEGNDTYEAIESSMGVGLHGVGLLIDGGGNDTYTVHGSWGQGVGHVGLGALIDRAGDDMYTAGRNSQAHGSTRGAGILIDLSGDDRYTIPDDAAPSALYLGRTVAMGQGCGYGRRADLGDSRSMAGGFGVLVDGAGDDHYTAMAWSQGAGYWWGVGILEDRGGNDTYRNGKYSQGAAAHFAVGIHVDLAGNDTYNVNPQKMVNPFTGQEQWIAENQYAGHARDGSMGIFVDGAGDDMYVLRANCAGNGDLNSIGFFWDVAGNDVYMGLDIDPQPANPNWTRPPMGTTTRYPDLFRGFRDDMLSYGVFIDASGRDMYADLVSPADNSSVWPTSHESGRGVGIDQ